MLRIFQEILTNVLKHSGADEVRATLTFEERRVCLVVQDDGRGFDLSRKHDGLGLLGMRERVNQMNGELELDSRVGGGTRIAIVLPDRSEGRGSGS